MRSARVSRGFSPATPGPHLLTPSPVGPHALTPSPVGPHPLTPSPLCGEGERSGRSFPLSRRERGPGGEDPKRGPGGEDPKRGPRGEDPRRGPEGEDLAPSVDTASRNFDVPVALDPARAADERRREPADEPDHDRAEDRRAEAGQLEPGHAPGQHLERDA